jgi:hypothetical protein
MQPIASGYDWFWNREDRERRQVLGFGFVKTKVECEHQSTKETMGF